MTLIGIIGASKFKEQVLNQREVLQSGKRNNTSESESVLSDKTNSLLEEIRDLLKDIKNN